MPTSIVANPPAKHPSTPLPGIYIYFDASPSPTPKPTPTPEYPQYITLNASSSPEPAAIESVMRETWGLPFVKVCFVVLMFAFFMAALSVFVRVAVFNFSNADKPIGSWDFFGVKMGETKESIDEKQTDSNKELLDSVEKVQEDIKSILTDLEAQGASINDIDKEMQVFTEFVLNTIADSQDESPV